MNSVYGDISDKIEVLYKMITKHDFPRNHDEWGGADVIITSNPCDTRQVPRKVVTRHAKEVSWLFDELKSAFEPLIDFDNKYEFYGRLGNRAINFIKTYGDPTDETGLCDLLLSILRKSYFALLDFQYDGFKCLPVTQNGQIFDENEADRTDWSIEVTRFYLGNPSRGMNEHCSRAFEKELERLFKEKGKDPKKS